MQRWTPTSRVIVTAVFLVGLLVRVEALGVPASVGSNETLAISRWHPESAAGYLETDERIYLALVDQLDAGRGYTLRGHPILDNPAIVRAQ